MKTQWFLYLTLSFVTLGTLSAQGNRHHRDEDDEWFDDDRDAYFNEHWQHARLTRDEIKLLECKRRHIQEVRRIYLRDGFLDRWEKRDLMRMRSDLRREYQRQINDRDHRHRGPGRPHHR